VEWGMCFYVILNSSKASLMTGGTDIY